jgi:hypothetical protein
MAQCPGFFSSENKIEQASVHQSSVETKTAVEGRTDIPSSMKLFPNPAVLQGLLVFTRFNV